MSDFDVERITEFEIEQLKEELHSSDNDMDMLMLYEQLVDALELRIQQLKDKMACPVDSGTESTKLG